MRTKTNMAYCGWDIGGAHLKVAYADSKGKLLNVFQLPCALWKGIDALTDTLKKALKQLPDEPISHYITMTGELVDAFNNREEGVKAIVNCVDTHLKADDLHFFAGQSGWLNKKQAILQWQDIASMNWQASAILAAKHIEQGLFIDIGSTTCDIIAIDNYQIQPAATTDYGRQRSGELVYTGAIRTPLMAITDEAPLHGDRISLAAEWFASSGDIWLLLDQLTSTDIQDESADGKPWNAIYSQQRLARMLGCDAHNASIAQWQNVAAWFAEKQLQQVIKGCHQVLSRFPDWKLSSPIVGAGVGKFIVEKCATRLNRPYIDYAQFCQHHPEASCFAPAAALALLAAPQSS